MKKLLLALTVLIVPTAVFAQSVSNTPSTSITAAVAGVVQGVNVPQEITNIQNSGLAVNTGFFYNWKDKSIQPTYTYAILGHLNVDNWGTWDYINVGYASPSVLIAGTGLVLNPAVIVKKWGITPTPYIQNLLNSSSIGLTPMVGLERIGGRNRFTGGPGGYLKISF